MVEKSAIAGQSERGDVEVRVDGHGGAKNFVLELMVPSPTSAAWKAEADAVNRACAKKEAEYEYIQRKYGSVPVGIIVDTHGGIADRTVAFLSHVIQQTAARHEQGVRLETAALRLQLAVVNGLFEGFECNRHDAAGRGQATPMLPRATAQSVDAARRELATALA
jgi:hypothetical protein